MTLALLWLLTMMAQVYAKGFAADILRRSLCFSLFWHALDIIWGGVVLGGVFDGSRTVSSTEHTDTAPGEERFEHEDIAQNLKVYLTAWGSRRC